MTLMHQGNKVCIAGSNGMVGSAIYRLLKKKGYKVNSTSLINLTRKDLDLTDYSKVMNWFKEFRPEIVIIAAAKVGGIMANKRYPVNFLLENLKIQNNLIEASWKFSVKRLLFLGSSCIYPKFCKQPIKEEYLLSGELEKSNQWYAIAKISGIKLCQAYREQYNFDAISAMPCNLYGPNDNYDLENGHVMASLIRKFYEAKIKNANAITCWGSGKPLREFLYVDDFALACIKILENWTPDNLSNSHNDKEKLNWINVGSNYEISIKGLAEKIASIVGFNGQIIWDQSKPDGVYRKKLEINRIINLDWEPKINLNDGISKALECFKKEFNY